MKENQRKNLKEGLFQDTLVTSWKEKLGDPGVIGCMTEDQAAEVTDMTGGEMITTELITGEERSGEIAGRGLQGEEIVEKGEEIVVIVPPRKDAGPGHLKRSADTDLLREDAEALPRKDPAAEPQRKETRDPPAAEDEKRRGK